MYPGLLVPPATTPQTQRSCPPAQLHAAQLRAQNANATCTFWYIDITGLKFTNIYIYIYICTYII